MKILMRQFLSCNHSWKIIGQSIARELISLGHNVDLFSTDGFDGVPDDLKPYVIGYSDDKSNKIYGRIPDGNYDTAICYTAMKNFQAYMPETIKNKFGIWCFEYAGRNALPLGFAKCYKFVDKLLPPSNFAKQVFLDSGVPNDAMTVVPHGIDFNLIDIAEPYKLKTKKSTKILVHPLGQIHRRKNIPGMLDMYGKAFTKSDDVCLVLKIQDRPPKQPFELSFSDLYKNFTEKYKNHAEVEIIKEYIPNIFSIFKSCDIVFSASNCEAFGIPALEALSLGKINIAPKYGGFIDFLNDDNALLIDGKIVPAPPNYLYWTSKIGTEMFAPNIDHGVEQLRFAVKNKNQLLEKYKSNIDVVREKYTWNNIVNQILGLCK